MVSMAGLSLPGHDVCDGLPDFDPNLPISHHTQPHITPPSHTPGHNDVCWHVPLGLWVYGLGFRGF